MSRNAEDFDRWIRTAFVEMNTALEDLYFAQDERSNVTGIGTAIKQALLAEGRAAIIPLKDEGNTGEGFASALAVLGNVGLFLGAIRRHEIEAPLQEAWSLALHVGASLGMAPRFATAHLATHNLAVLGVRKSFTSLQDEFLFIDENTRGILCFQRAADALARIGPLGVSSPIAEMLFRDATDALDGVIRYNDSLFARLDVDRFFYSVRPYYKPYRVGRQEYRGANAGDFAGINQIDLLLGLCRANDAYYAQLIVDKLPYMLPEEQARLRDCMAQPSLLDGFLALEPDHGDALWFRTNVAAYLETCDRFAASANQHHDQLVHRFITRPAADLPAPSLAGVTASGPPLDALLRALRHLRDLRCANPLPDGTSRHADLTRLRARIG